MTWGLPLAQQPDRHRTVSLAPILMFAVFLTSRPSVLGEIFTTASLGLAIVAAILAVLEDRDLRLSQMSMPIIVLLGAAQLWLLFRRGDTGQVADPRATAILLLVLFAASIVFSSATRVVQFVKIFVGAVLLLCASCCVTAILWAVGIQLPLFGFFTGQWTATVLFPFTPSIGSVWVSGVLMPRFGGVGREPGWMGMYIAFAAVAWRWVGKPSWWGYLVFAGGLLCTLSTAGFGIFVVVIAYEVFFRVRRDDTRGMIFSRLLIGSLVVAAAVWAALFAPVVGLLAKSDINALSLDERSSVMQLGFRALATLSLGSPTGVVNDGIGLVAATAPNGWPYFVLVSAAFLVPLAVSRRQVPVAMVAVLYLTILLAQPPQDSIAVYVLLVTAFALAKHGEASANEAKEHLSIREEIVS